MFSQFAFIGTTELVVILLIVLLLFGSKKLPELSRSIGQSVSELRKGMGNDAAKDKKNQADRTA